MTDTLQKQNKLIAVYGRVSTSNQENEGTIETQLSAVEEHARKNGYVIVQRYLDEGWSGDTIVRPALDQLRVDAKKKNWEAVLIYDPDRLARRGAWQEVVTEELHELGIDVLYVTVPQAKTDEDKIMSKMRGVFAEYERMKIKERFRLGKVRKAKEGHIIASEAPYGYTFIIRTAERQGYYEINEVEASVVKDIFVWVADEGLTLRSVVRRLQELAIMPRKSKRGVWNTSTLSKLLKNQTYIGEANYGVSYAVVPENPLKDQKYKKIKKTSRRSKPESEWIKIKTPQIIDKELFDRAGLRMKKNFDASVRNTKNEYLLAGKIWCTCGVRRTGEGPQHGKHLYYRCSNRVYNFPLPKTCFEGGINARIADNLVWKKVSVLMCSPEQLKKQIERWLESKTEGIQHTTVNLSGVKSEIAKLKEQLDKYAKAYSADVISLEQLREYTLPLKERISVLEKQVISANSEKSKKESLNLPKQDEIEAFAQKSVEGLQNLDFKTKQEIIRNIIEKVEANQKELIVSGYIPLEHQNYVEYKTSHRNCWTSKCW
jgi:site-specific DNA recombinase